MKKTIIQESDEGVVYCFDKIPNTLFRFYILKRRKFKDGTHLWDIGVELTTDISKCMKLDDIRGHKADAVKRLEEIVKIIN